MYLKGIGVAKKPKKAFDIYFDLVNTVKHPLSYEKLGWCYYKGIGVNANFKLAVKNFKISSQKNHDSQFHFANCFRKGFGVEKSLQKFFEWISVATQHENVKAQITIGNLYRKGRLLKKDLFKSSQWYTRAASKVLWEMELGFPTGRCSSPHSKKTMNFLKKRCHVLDPWPPNSPDLNPIGNLWGIMDKHLEKHKPENKENFIQILKDVWGKVTWETMENLANSMEKRIQLVISRNGQLINGFY
ncbi:transposable element tc1 transposase [Anaeramoeba flamelloides]|uniref:Transposable element tc1 transposase n=1 Tax=Anaeramoeba flamelloides TaxID=1746091 RepID=A0ABQ8ZEZ9_9EUKA|nr:transposable element tc1 transposase [Anaeramoeba flamelloides]